MDGENIFSVSLGDEEIQSGFFRDSVSVRREEGRVLLSVDGREPRELPLRDIIERNQVSRSPMTVEAVDGGFVATCDKAVMRVGDGELCDRVVLTDGGSVSQNLVRFSFRSVEGVIGIEFLCDDLFPADGEWGPLFRYTGELADSGSRMSLRIDSDGETVLEECGPLGTYGPPLPRDVTPGTHDVSVTVEVHGAGPWGAPLRVSRRRDVTVRPLCEFLESDIGPGIHRWVGALAADRGLLDALEREGLTGGCLGYPPPTDPGYMDTMMGSIGRVYDFVSELGISEKAGKTSQHPGRQHLRGFGEMLEEGANCIELSSLFSVCFIHCGISPVIVILEGGIRHAVVGVLTDTGRIGTLRCHADDETLTEIRIRDERGPITMRAVLFDAVKSASSETLDEAIRSVRENAGGTVRCGWDRANPVGIRLGLKPARRYRGRSRTPTGREPRPPFPEAHHPVRRSSSCTKVRRQEHERR